MTQFPSYYTRRIFFEVTTVYNLIFPYIQSYRITLWPWFGLTFPMQKLSFALWCVIFKATVCVCVMQTSVGGKWGVIFFFVKLCLVEIFKDHSINYQRHWTLTGKGFWPYPVQPSDPGLPLVAASSERWKGRLRGTGDLWSLCLTPWRH